MTPVLLQQWIQHPEALNRDTLYELRTLIARYPYFQSLRLLYLKNLYLLHDSSFGAELRKAVLYVSDRRVLFYLIEGDKYTLHPHASTREGKEDLDKEPRIDRTLSLIDAFLATVPEEHSQSTELDYVVDYTSYLIQENEEDDDAEDASLEGTVEAPKLRGQDLIDVFLSRDETAVTSEETVRPAELEVEQDESEEEPEEEESDEETPSKTASDELDDSCFTETLAKIYIKQHRYDKALEIIKNISYLNGDCILVHVFHCIDSKL